MVKAVLIGILLLANLTIAIVMPNAASSVVALCLYLIAAWMMFVADPVGTWMLSPLIFLQTSVLVSLNVIEGGAYMIEMGETGHRSTASASYVIYSLLMLAAALFARHLFSRWRSRLPRVPSRGVPSARPPLHPFFHVACLLICSFCFVWLLLTGLRTGFPLLTHTDRFVYRRLYADVLTVNILDLKFMPPLALGVATLVTRGAVLRALYIIMSIGLLLEGFLFADKGFIILLSLILYAFPFIIHDPARAVSRVTRLLPFMGIGVTASFLVTFFIYSDFGAKDASATFQKFGERIASQGELWYEAVEKSGHAVSFDGKAVAANAISTLQKDPADYLFRHRLAPYYFVHACAPPKMYQSFLHNQGSVTPTMVSEAYGLVLFGYLGLMIQTIMFGLVAAAATFYVEAAISTGNPLMTLLPAFAFNGFMKCYEQATIFSLLSVPIAKSYAAFLVMAGLVKLADFGLRPAARVRAGAARRMAGRVGVQA